MVDVPYLRVFPHRTTGRRIIDRHCLFQPLCWRSDLIHDENPNGENGWHFLEFIPFERNEIYATIERIRTLIDNPPTMSFDHRYPMMRIPLDEGREMAGLGHKIRSYENDYGKPYVFGIEDEIEEDDEEDVYVPLGEAERPEWTADKQAEAIEKQFGGKGPSRLRAGSVSLVAAQTLYYLQNGWNLTPVKGTDKNGDDYWWLEDATENPKKPQVFDILGKTPLSDNFTPPFNNGKKVPFNTPYNAPIAPTLRLGCLTAARGNLSSRLDFITYPNYREGHIPESVYQYLDEMDLEMTERHKAPEFVERLHYRAHIGYFNQEEYYVPFKLPKWLNLEGRTINE